MDNQMTIWALTVGCLFLFFIFRVIQEMRHETGHERTFEMGDEFEIYNDDDDNDW